MATHHGIAHPTVNRSIMAARGVLGRGLIEKRKRIEFAYDLCRHLTQCYLDDLEGDVVRALASSGITAPTTASSDMFLGDSSDLAGRAEECARLFVARPPLGGGQVGSAPSRMPLVSAGSCGIIWGAVEEPCGADHAGSALGFGSLAVSHSVCVCVLSEPMGERRRL